MRFGLGAGATGRAELSSRLEGHEPEKVQSPTQPHRDTCTTLGLAESALTRTHTLVPQHGRGEVQEDDRVRRATAKAEEYLSRDREPD